MCLLWFLVLLAFLAAEEEMHLCFVVVDGMLRWLEWADMALRR